MPKHSFQVEGGALPGATLAVTPDMRTRIATTIENLIALLDDIDGDADLEEDADREEETDIDLADAYSDLEADDALDDAPGHIWGGAE